MSVRLIDQWLTKIRTAIYGREVRDAIANGIEECYNEASSQTEAYVDSYIATKKGVANGLAGLDSSGMIPTSQLPSYVDDVLEYAKLSGFPSPGETGKIYVAKDTNRTYRWSGTTYVEISKSLALGTTSSTAYRGDYGNAAHAHAVTNKGAATTGSESSNQTPAFGATFSVSQVVSNAEGHVTSQTTRTVKIPDAVATTTASGLMSSTDKSNLNATYAHAVTNKGTATTGAETKNQTPAFGGTFSVSQVVSNDEGHVTAQTKRTVKIPNAVATTTAAGLMSSADKTYLDTAIISVSVEFIEPGVVDRTFEVNGLTRDYIAISIEPFAYTDESGSGSSDDGGAVVDPGDSGSGDGEESAADPDDPSSGETEIETGGTGEDDLIVSKLQIETGHNSFRLKGEFSKQLDLDIVFVKAGHHYNVYYTEPAEEPETP